jgi:hypothetical protein
VLRLGSLLLLSALLAHAPMQCAGEPDPAKAIEETPGEALYKLAAEFQRRGDRAAWEGTLRFLMRNYPSSRFALRAEQDLGDAGIDAGDSLAVGGARPDDAGG